METSEKARKVFESHILLRLATIDQQGMPKVRSVDFAIDKEDESVLYFMTFNLTNKVKELQNNNNVHIVVDKDAHSMEELSQVLYVKGSGKAYPLQTPDEIQKAMGMILGKYPYLKDMPGDPSAMAFFKIELDRIIVTDNSISFGYVEEYQYR